MQLIPIHYWPFTQLLEVLQYGKGISFLVLENFSIFLTQIEYIMHVTIYNYLMIKFTFQLSIYLHHCLINLFSMELLNLVTYLFLIFSLSHLNIPAFI
jgi:hypothetical protein